MSGRKRSEVTLGVLAIVALVAVAAAILRLGFLGDGGSRALIASGTVEATEAQLGFQVPGRIEAIAVKEGDAVTAGSELARLDRAEVEARRAQAEAQVAGARALLTELERGSRREEIAQARAERDAARERKVDAERDLERVRRLHDGGAVSQEALDKAVLGLEVAASRYAQTAEQLRLLEAGPRPERIAAQRAALDQAVAAVRAIDATLANMVIRSAFGGVVTVRHREPGESVAAGAPVLTVMNRDDRWVRIYVPENRLASVHLGQRATIASDTYHGVTYGGEVVFIASEAEFTPKNVQTTEERVKLVYAVKVRITGDPRYDLKPGMPVDVTLDLEATSPAT